MSHIEWQQYSFLIMRIFIRRESTWHSIS